MKLQHIVFAYNVEGKKQIRTFFIGDVELASFPETFRFDGAVHDNFRMLSDYDAVNYLTSIIKNLVSKGYTFDDFHYEFVGIFGYTEALSLIKKELELHKR